MKKTYKISSDVNNPTKALQDIIKELNSDNEYLIEFEKGCYHFQRAGLEKQRIFSSSTKSGENYVLFSVNNKCNITIEGNGSEFVFCDRMQPFMFQNCENIVLKNFSMDYSFLRYAYGKVVSITEEGFEIAIDPNIFDYTVDNGFLNFICGVETLSSKYRKISMKRIEPSGSATYFMYAGDVVAAKNPAASSVDVDARKTENGVFFCYREGTTHPEFNVGDTVCLAYDNDREAQAFYFESCKNVGIENISVYRNAGMCFVADTSENIIIDGLKIAIKDGRKEYYSSTADGIFLTQCSGDFVLKNSIIKDTYDDVLNVHGFYTYVTEVISENLIKVGFLHPAHWGLIPCFKGDVLYVNEPNTFNKIGSATVKDITYDENRENICLTIVCDVELAKGMLLENVNRMPNVLVENNTVINCPNMRLSSPNVIVKNNYFERMGLFICDLIDFWGESGAVNSALICNNKFGEAAGYNVEVCSCRPENSNRLHEKVVVRDNEFKNDSEQAMKFSAVNELIVENNIFGIE